MDVREKRNSMRLCDLDEIKVCVDRQYENCHGYSGSKKAIYREAILAVKSILHSAKPIEADPVRHGYWENANGRPKTYIRKCSVCGKEAYFCGRGCSYKFCPNCGAKMDKDA